jgi:hypothetical protein
MRHLPAVLAAACGLAVLPAAAEESPETQGAADRERLRRALAEVNEGGRDPAPPIPGRGAGFFGEGFYMTFEPVAPGASGDRVGPRPETSTTYEPGRSDAFLRR